MSGPDRSTRRHRVRRLFEEVVDLDAEERGARLERSCGDDPVLRREIESLLEANARAGETLGALDAAIPPPDSSRSAGDEVSGPGHGPAWRAPGGSAYERSGADDPLPGSTVSHYEVGRRIGGGGMGVVYEARDLRLDRDVALKFLPQHLSTDRRAVDRFVREAKAASALNHPSICTIHAIDETRDGRIFIAMALYRGETLARRIARGPLPFSECAAIALDIARGLE